MAVPLRRLALDRRALLRGCGAAVALPWLDAMEPALSSAPKSPPKAVFIFSPNGMRMDHWTPKSTGRNHDFPELLQPLKAHRDRLRVHTGLAIRGATALGDGPGDHARSAAAFLTCAHPRKTGGADIKNGVSIDQLIAQRIGSQSRFASLELGMEAGRRAGVCDSGYSCAYTNNVSWKSDTLPVAKEVRPKEVFARLFGDPDELLDLEARKRKRARRLSLLDLVQADAKDLRRRLGSKDRSKLEQYLEALRELEKRIEASEGAQDGVAVPDDLNRRSRGSYQARLRLMYELITLALGTESTRVISFMLGNGGSNRSYRFLGVQRGHHYLSHHGGKKDKMADILTINKYQMEEFARFIDGLRKVKDGRGDLLDSSFIVLGSGIADGNRHNHHDLPLLLLGRGGKKLAPGHFEHRKHTPAANLYLSILDAMTGKRSASFADSSDRIF